MEQSNAAKTGLELILALFPPQDYTSHPCWQGVKKYRVGCSQPACS